MLVSTKGRYAIRVMIDLAEHDREAYIPLKEIAKRQNISEKYLEVIVKSLSQAHYIEGLRGKGGGYRLVNDPSTYRISDIIELMEGTLSPVSTIKGEPITFEDNTKTLWEGLEDVIRKYLDNITIQDLSTPVQSGDFYII
ncbi:MAG: Rrf2 family transcriptional regulator [Erysipelotrichaceae bacterium]|nr:Rrf2 family transcriptional regulator [Erysipelotrichaceae bacterium]